MNIMQMRRGMGGGGGGAIRYEEYDYITGVNQYSYINTGYNATPNTLCSINVEVSANNDGFILGARSQTAIPGRKSYGLVWTISNGHWCFRVDRNDWVYNAGNESLNLPGIFLNVQLDYSIAYIGGISVSIPPYTTQSNLPILLFAMNTGGTISASIQNAKIGRTKFYTAITTEREFVPAKLLASTDRTWDGLTHYAGEVGMVDIQNDIFYGSEDPRGGFVAGNL